MRSGQRTWYKEERRVKRGGLEKDDGSPTRREAEDMSHRAGMLMALYALNLQGHVKWLVGWSCCESSKMSQLRLSLKAGEGLGKSACYSTCTSYWEAIKLPTLIALTDIIDTASLQFFFDTEM